MDGASHFLSVNGVRLHYLRWGDGPPAVLFLHPNSHCAGVWAPLAERLAANGIGAVALDMRGHGRSGKPERDYGWPFLRDDAIALLDALNMHDVLLVGHSRGGGVTLLTAAAASERVRGVLVFEPTLPPGLVSAGAPAAAVAARVARLGERARGRRAVFAGREEALAHFGSREAYKHWRQEYLRAFVDHATLPRDDGTRELACPGWVEARLYEVMGERDAWDGVCCPDLPVVAMYGDRSGRLGEGRDPMAAVRRMFPRAELVVMPDGTHFGPMEQPEFFERAVRDLAARVGVTSG